MFMRDRATGIALYCSTEDYFLPISEVALRYSTGEIEQAQIATVNGRKKRMMAMNRIRTQPKSYVGILWAFSNSVAMSAWSSDLLLWNLIA